MNFAQMAAMHRRLCKTDAKVRRSLKGPGVKPEMISFEANVKCAVWARGNLPRENELAGTKLKQFEYMAAILTESLQKAQWPGEVLIGDKLIVNGKVYNVETVDALTRSVRGEVVAYEVTLKG